VEVLGDKISGGIVVTKDDHEPGPEVLETVFASHPEPDERGSGGGPEDDGTWRSLSGKTTCS
jgi:glycerate-2-kinase